MSAFDVEEMLLKNSELIEGALDDLLPKGDAAYSVIYRAMRYSALGGGKRVRPTLTLEFCRLAGGKIEAAIPYAAAIECVHTYSLIHDDLPCMDNSDERRGRPSCHVAYGEANALLAGDALLTYAFSLAAENPFADDGRNCRAVSVIANAAGFDGMIGGQVCDLIYEKSAPSFEDFMDMERGKTVELISAACALGLVAARADDDLFAAARKYAYCIGLSFQIIDDILDGDETGNTVLSYMSADEAAATARDLTEEAKSAICAYDGAQSLIALADWLCGRKK
ncbi:MAG: polyprenyl synthetase family protein [Firmicutes bacterium]|nr:polyprenyl synthetase family protein [Bacillota bacterium]